MLVVVLGGVTTTGTTDDTSTAVDTCNDGIDNDMDGFADNQDGECNEMSPGYDGNEDDPSI